MSLRLPGSFFLRNLVERRSLLFQLVRRDFQQRFVGSAGAWSWGLVQPLVLLTSWVFVFQYCLKTQPPPGVGSYPLFLFGGMLPWLLFNETVQRSATCILDQAGLITKTVFPAEIVPVSVFLSSLVGHLLALTLMLGAAVIWVHRFSPLLLLLPLYMLAIGLMAVGIGWIVGSLHVFLRDTAQVLGVALTFWFWLTPIFIAETSFPERARFLLVLNPLSYVVRGYRTILLGMNGPAVADLGVALAFGLVLFCAGGLFFRHMKRGFADVL